MSNVPLPPFVECVLPMFDKGQSVLTFWHADLHGTVDVCLWLVHSSGRYRLTLANPSNPAARKVYSRGSRINCIGRGFGTYIEPLRDTPDPLARGVELAALFLAYERESVTASAERAKLLGLSHGHILDRLDRLHEPRARWA